MYHTRTNFVNRFAQWAAMFANPQKKYQITNPETLKDKKFESEIRSLHKKVILITNNYKSKIIRFQFGLESSSNGCKP